MEQDLIRPPSNGYNYLESYTTALYDNRGTFRHNLERYVYSQEFQEACRMPKTIEEIPEISFDEIKTQIQRETHFFKLCDHVMETYAQREQNGQLTDEDYYEVAGIMGLCPGQFDWHETLFPHLVDLFVSSEEEGSLILEHAKQHPNIIRVMVSVMSNGLRKGEIIRHNSRDLWSQGYARNYFRGENAYNVRCLPSVFRNLQPNPNHQLIDRIVSTMRVIEFSLWLQSLSFVRNWPYGDVFHGAIAQHYGIPSNGIDVTSDLKTALFFACCHCGENNVWRPLDPKEYERKDSRDSVTKRGGDARYGIIFTAPADMANMSTAAQIPELHLTSVTPIGFQPFMRCSSQSGYVIEAGYPYDLFQDPGFSKFKFRLIPEICNWFFQEMDQGKSVYPQEKFGTCQDIVDAVNAQTNFSEQAFLLAIERMNLRPQVNHVRQELEKNAYHIVPSVKLCNDARRAELEDNYFSTYQENMHQNMPAYIHLQFSI